MKRLFPDGQIQTDNRGDDEQPECPQVTTHEVIAAARKLKPGRAGGPDGIPPEMVKLAALERTKLVRDVMDQCLKTGRFPTKWKKGRLVLIPKPGKPQGDPSAYRPLCLLDTYGKLLERLIVRITP